MQARAFNSVSINHQSGLFTKSSINVPKLKDEINYYLGLPKKIADFFPQLIDYKKDYTAYTVEYVPYKDLSELILNDQLSLNQGREVMIKLTEMMIEIHKHEPSLKRSATEISHFYVSKTLERIDQFALIPEFKALLEKSSLEINGKTFQSFDRLKSRFVKTMQDFATRHLQTSAIHGDFCFSNILYCPITQEIKLIDPRGSFGKAGIFGHSYYDYAKLLHCLHGKYDFIMNDDYDLREISDAAFIFKKRSSPLLYGMRSAYQTLLREKDVDLEFLYLIEASLFLSMAVLHYEDRHRQKALFLNGLIILNKFFEGRYENLH